MEEKDAWEKGEETLRILPFLFLSFFFFFFTGLSSIRGDVPRGFSMTFEQLALVLSLSHLILPLVRRLVRAGLLSVNNAARDV